MTQSPPKVACLGGGFAGVLVASVLLERGYDVHVFEASPHLGGLCRSETVDGFVFDLAGGHVLHSRDPEILEKMVATLDDPVLCDRNTKIFYEGRYVKYPFENGFGDLPLSHNYECLQGYVDAHMERAAGAAEPENFRDWIDWRFGVGMARRFMVPYNEKIWCSDLRLVSSEWCSGRVAEAPLDDVLKASLGVGSEGYTHQSQFYYPRTGGFGSMVEAYARDLGDRVRTSTPVRSVKRLAVDADKAQPGGNADPGASACEVNGERFDRVVNTLPLKDFFPTLDPAAPDEVREALDALGHLSLTTVFVALDTPSTVPYSWIYLPHPENGPMNRLTHLSNYSPENAPPGCSSILAEITSPGGEGRPDLGALEAQVVDCLAEMGMIEKAKVRFTRSAFFEYAYPVYGLGMKDKLARVLDWVDASGIVSLGRFARYAYVNTDQVVAMVDDALADDFARIA